MCDGGSAGSGSAGHGGYGGGFYGNGGSYYSPGGYDPNAGAPTNGSDTENSSGSNMVAAPPKPVAVALDPSTIDFGRAGLTDWANQQRDAILGQYRTYAEGLYGDQAKSFYDSELENLTKTLSQTRMTGGAYEADRRAKLLDAYNGSLANSGGVLDGLVSNFGKTLDGKGLFSGTIPDGYASGSSLEGAETFDVNQDGLSQFLSTSAMQALPEGLDTALQNPFADLSQGDMAPTQALGSSGAFSGTKGQRTANDSGQSSMVTQLFAPKPSSGGGGGAVSNSAKIVG